ncbi:MAG: SWIM zinc finger family protein [Halobacteriaceae archaeon]
MASVHPERRAVVPDGPRDSRAARALAERMAVVPVADGDYDVVTEDDHVYTVDLPRGSCTCPDHRIRDATCKHLIRVTHEVEAGTVPAPGERRARCAACSTEFYAPEDRIDPVYCEACTLAPGEPVRDRESGDVLVVVRSTDHRVTQVAVPGTDHSVAAHPGNEDYDPADIVVEAMYPLPAGLSPEAVRGRRVRSYSFPRDRLERVL